jgi:hypothetical protein
LRAGLPPPSSRSARQPTTVFKLVDWLFDRQLNVVDKAMSLAGPRRRDGQPGVDIAVGEDEVAQRKGEDVVDQLVRPLSSSGAAAKDIADFQAAIQTIEPLR